MLQKGFSIAGLMKAITRDEARGRLGQRRPVAIIDIGSNSVRQVVYEGLTRSPSILFNEKVLCGLGSGVARNKRLDETAAARALRAIARFLALGRHLQVEDTHILATAAVREAENGQDFIDKITSLSGKPITVITGEMEAYYAGLGVEAGFYKPSGIAGDLGGGSTELICVLPGREHIGATTPLGGLRLQENSEGDLNKARKIVKRALDDVDLAWPSKKRTYYAVGGTWRSLSRLHMLETKYPLLVHHGYTVDAIEYQEFCEQLIEKGISNFDCADEISKNRRELLPYGAIVMSEIISRFGVKEVATSAVGLREGFLYSLLDDQSRKQDALLEATAELSILRARSLGHGRELSKWIGSALRALEIKETENQKRWRIAACNLADIVWRSASDFRAEQTLGIINNAGFNSISHEGRAFLALVSFHRYQGLGPKKVPPESSVLASKDTARLARIVAALFRVLYLFSAGETGVLSKLKLVRNKEGKLELQVPAKLLVMVGEKPESRIEQLGRELGEEILVQTASKSN